MIRYLMILVLAIPFLSGCGGGGGEDGTTPIRMKGELNFDSATIKHAKVALVTLDINDNWVTVSTSGEISNGGQGWEWGGYSLDLPIVKKNSAYGILAYDDVNHNGKFDEVDYENIGNIDYYVSYYASSKKWELTNYNDEFLGYIPNTKVYIDTSIYYSSQSIGKAKTSDTSKSKEIYKKLRLKVEGR